MQSAAILAGGRASRFGGQDKSALVDGGRTILDRQIAELSRVTSDILVVGGTGSRDRDLGVTAPRHIAELVPDCGRGGVHAALTAARGDALFIVACDMPYIDATLVGSTLRRIPTTRVAVIRCALRTRERAWARSLAVWPTGD
jgi:molybdopterin-guanine dinucleotide biosynthesis protein A